MDLLDYIFKVLFTGYGFSMLLSCLLFWYKNPSFQRYNTQFIQSAVVLIRWVGIAWLLVLISVFLQPASLLIPKLSIYDRIFGTHWLSFWVWFTTNFVLTQLLWMNKLKNSIAIRFLFAILMVFVISYESFVIVMISFERDYLDPTYLYSDSLWFLWYNVLYAIVFTTIVFVLPIGTDRKKNTIHLLDEDNS